MEKNKTILLAVIGIEALIILGLSLFLFFGDKIGIPLLTKETPEQAAQSAIKYINENFLASAQGKAELKKVEESNNLYKITFDIGEREYISYVSKDGQLLFPEAIDMKPLPPKEFPKTAKPDVKLFVMSYCPYGNQAEDAMFPVVNLLKDKANIEVHYIFYKNYQSGYPEYCIDKENQYCAMHGIQEFNQNIRELCVWKYQKDKFWSFVKDMNVKADYKTADKKWEGVAGALGIDVQKIKDCQKNEALSFAAQEVALTSKEYLVQDPAKNQGKETTTVSGSPTLVINGVVFDGQRSAEGYKNAICAAFKKEPPECSQSLGDESPSSVSGGSCQ